MKWKGAAEQLKAVRNVLWMTAARTLWKLYDSNPTRRAAGPSPMAACPKYPQASWIAELGRFFSGIYDIGKVL